MEPTTNRVLDLNPFLELKERWKVGDPIHPHYEFAKRRELVQRLTSTASPLTESERQIVDGFTPPYKWLADGGALCV